MTEESNGPAQCQPCPRGAECLGATLPPIARPGFGRLLVSTNSSNFYACAKQLTCADGEEDCDCLGGGWSMEKGASEGGEAIKWVAVPVRCGFGFDNTSSLCSRCDLSVGYAAQGNGCRECIFGNGFNQLLVAAGATTLFFPVLRYVKAKYESLEITRLSRPCSVLGTFSIPFAEPVASVLSSLAFFNFDLAVLGLPCLQISYSSMWIIQTLLLPLLYPLCCLLHFLTLLLLSRLAKNHTCVQLLFRLGWRPRRWSCDSIHHMYLPAAIDYLNMYYLTGVAKSFEMLKCSKNEPSFLVASPSMLCWEGEHLSLLPLAAASTFFYLVGVPCLYAHVMFQLVPRLGLHHRELQADYGFLWLRFEEKYYWWELVDVQRKLVFVVIQIWIDEPLHKTVCALMVVIFVLSANLYARPYVNEMYDVLELIISSLELWVLLTVMVALYRNLFTQVVQVGILLTISAPVAQLFASLHVCYVWQDESIALMEANTLEMIVIALIAAGLLISSLVLLRELILAHRERRFRRLRESQALRLDRSIFALSDAGLLSWLQRGEDIELQRDVERLLTSTLFDFMYDEKERALTRSYGALADVHGCMLDSLLGTMGVSSEKEMSERTARAVRDLASLVRCMQLQRADEPGASALFNMREVGGMLLRLLCDEATPEESKRLLARFVSSARGERSAWGRIGERQLSLGEPSAGSNSSMLSARLAGASRWQLPRLALRFRVSSRSKTSRQLPKEPVTLQQLVCSGRFDVTRITSLLTSKLQALLDRVLIDTSCESVLFIPLKDGSAAKLPLVCTGRGLSQWASCEPQGGSHADWSLHERSPAGLCASTGENVLVDNLWLDSRGFSKKHLDFGSISQLCMPIRISRSDGKQELVAVMKLLNKKSRDGSRYVLPFSSMDVTTCNIFAELVSKAIKKSLLQMTKAHRKHLVKLMISHARSVKHARASSDLLCAKLSGAQQDGPNVTSINTLWVNIHIALVSDFAAALMLQTQRARNAITLDEYCARYCSDDVKRVAPRYVADKGAFAHKISAHLRGALGDRRDDDERLGARVAVHLLLLPRGARPR
ncbi:MAG: hypothetical protein SGPRY_006751, partial [Prymnesium sp.]